MSVQAQERTAGRFLWCFRAYDIDRGTKKKQQKFWMSTYRLQTCRTPAATLRSPLYNSPRAGRTRPVVLLLRRFLGIGRHIVVALLAPGRIITPNISRPRCMRTNSSGNSLMVLPCASASALVVIHAYLFDRSGNVFRPRGPLDRHLNLVRRPCFFVSYALPSPAPGLSVEMGRRDEGGVLLVAIAGIVVLVEDVGGEYLGRIESAGRRKTVCGS